MFAEKFFDLSTFAHRTVFIPGQPVWHALTQIALYFSTVEWGDMQGDVETGAHLVHPEQIALGKGSVIEAGATVIGPCILGQNCQVRQGAYIRGNVITGDGCVIGHATEVKNALFLEGAHAAHFAYVGDSILGNHVNLGAGTKCANTRFDGGVIRIGGKETGLRKCGAIIGDHTHIGCNAVTNPGTLIGKRSKCYPCLSISGVLPDDTLFKGPHHALQTENR